MSIVVNISPSSKGASFARVHYRDRWRPFWRSTDDASDRTVLPYCAASSGFRLLSLSHHFHNNGASDISPCLWSVVGSGAAALD